MPNYHRAHVPGGTFFFTLVTEGRAPFLCEDVARDLLRDAIQRTLAARPFVPEAFVLLPDHLHAMWTLPDGDSDFSTRWAAVKADFTRAWLARGGGEQVRTDSRRRNRRRGVWQRRFWEHWVRDREDFGGCLDYIHYNPVKHGLVRCPHAWPYSTFHKWVKLGAYEPDWHCVCGGKVARPPDFSGMEGLEGE